MATKQTRKVALINIFDYPRKKYFAYWEIRVDGNDADGYGYGARIYSFDTHELLDEVTGEAETRDLADTAAQTWVLDRIEQYRRPEPPQADPQQAGYAAAAGPFGMVYGPLGMAFDVLRALLDMLLAPLYMALGFATTLRNSMLNQITTALDAGAGAALFRIYDGTRPATCGTATTLLAELTMTDPSASAASGGVWTASSITADSSANATGTATWFRCVDSTGTCVLDGNVGTSGSDLNLNSTSISVGQNVSVTSWTITAGNA